MRVGGKVIVGFWQKLALDTLLEKDRFVPLSGVLLPADADP